MGESSKYLRSDRTEMLRLRSQVRTKQRFLTVRGPVGRRTRRGILRVVGPGATGHVGGRVDGTGRIHLVQPCARQAAGAGPAAGHAQIAQPRTRRQLITVFRDTTSLSADRSRTTDLPRMLEAPCTALRSRLRTTTGSSTSSVNRAGLWPDRPTRRCRRTLSDPLNRGSDRVRHHAWIRCRGTSLRSL